MGCNGGFAPAMSYLPINQFRRGKVAVAVVDIVVVQF